MLYVWVDARLVGVAACRCAVGTSMLRGPSSGIVRCCVVSVAALYVTTVDTANLWCDALHVAALLV